MRTNIHASASAGLMLAAGLVLAPAAAVAAAAAAQTTGLLSFFLLDSEPRSLEASAVAVNTVGTGANTHPVTTLRLACPTAASPDNDACRAAGIYPAQVYHTQGSVFGGTTTYGADDSTTTWVCELGGNDPTLTASCTKTIVAVGGGGSSSSSTTTRTETAAYDNCYVAAHQLPVVVTAGVDKISAAHYYTIDASSYVALQSSRLAEDKCPASQTTIWAGAAAAAATTTATTSGAAAVSSTGNASGAGGGAGSEVTTPTPTAPGPAATTSTGGAGGMPGTTGAVLFGVGAMAMLGIAW